MNNRKKIGIGAIAVILCAIFFYFGYWTKTPTYSIGLIQDAVESHDTAQFRKHVNVRHLLNKVYDDLLVITDEITGEKMKNDQFTMRFMKRMRTVYVGNMESALMNGVEGKEDTSPSQSGFTSGLFDNFSQKNIEVKNISVKEMQDGTAYVDLTLNDRNITVKMTELEDGTWCAEEITNLANFFSEAEKQDLRTRYEKISAVLNRI